MVFYSDGLNALIWEIIGYHFWDSLKSLCDGLSVYLEDIIRALLFILLGILFEIL